MGAEALKNAFNEAMVGRFGLTVATVYSPFDRTAFSKNITTEFEPLELKKRSLFLAKRLRILLPDSIPVTLKLLIELLKNPEPGPANQPNAGFFYWPISDFVEHFALDFPHEAMETNYWLTQRFTAEFSIRPFLEAHPELVLQKLGTWVSDDNEHVRRLVSEGTRPRLPWAKQLPNFIRNPEPLFPLLEKLLNDPSLYVRRSVANHLNDIGKDHPERVIDYIEQWSTEAGEHFSWVVKHALRNHLKQGDSRAMRLLGFHPPEVKLRNFCVARDELVLGQCLDFSFEIENKEGYSQSLMIDYVLYRPNAKGVQISKVFKLATIELPTQTTKEFKKMHRIQQLSTRTYYFGVYEVGLQVNGLELSRRTFLLKDDLSL